MLFHQIISNTPTSAGEISGADPTDNRNNGRVLRVEFKEREKKKNPPPETDRTNRPDEERGRPVRWKLFFDFSRGKSNFLPGNNIRKCTQCVP